VKVRDVMTTQLVTVTPDTPYKAIVERSVLGDVSGVPVVDSSGQLVGIVTEADLVSKEAYGGRRRRALALLADVLSAREHHWVTKASGSTAADVMTRNAIVCRPGDDVRVAARRLLESGIKRMPVVDETGDLVGIVSRKDILQAFTRSDDAIAADVGALLVTHPNRPDDCHVHYAVADGVVTLTGDVRYDWDKAIVVSLVREVEGVIDVMSQLHNREADPHGPSPWALGIR
jgi:CBS domain-containing protein